MGVLEEQHAAHERRLKAAERRLDEHLERLDKGDDRMTELAGAIAEAKAAVDAGNKITEDVKKNTDVFVKWVQNVTGFNNVVNWAFALLIKLSVVIAAAGIVWYFVTERHLPKKVEAPIALERVG